MDNRPKSLPEPPVIDTSRVVKSPLIKSGTDDWWTWIAMMKVADRERKRLGLSQTDSVTISADLCNEYLQGLNLPKRLWLLFTIGDLRPVDRGKLGKEIGIRDERGDVRHFYKD